MHKADYEIFFIYRLNGNMYINTDSGNFRHCLAMGDFYAQSVLPGADIVSIQIVRGGNE